MPDGLGPVTLPTAASFDWWAIAGTEFRKRIDDDIRRRSPGGVLPWHRPVRTGEVDWWRVHAYALDRIDELLLRALPLREESEPVDLLRPIADFADALARLDGLLSYGCAASWRGRHDERSNWITVGLLTGEWADPAAGKRGRDLVGLVGHIYGITPRRAALRLGAWVGVEAVRHG